MVRVCAIQYEMRPLSSFEEFAGQARYFVKIAAGHKADFALFPEMLTYQLLQLSPGLKGQDAMKAVAGFTERYLQLFSTLATELRVNIIAGSHCVAEGNSLLNASYLFHRSGKTERQVKLHVTPSEKDGWEIAAGSKVEVFDTDQGKVAINICYDVEFPEVTRIATDRGARIVFVPYCTEDRQGHLRVRYCAQARAIENQIYVVTAGVVGNLRDVDNMDVHYAQSGIFTPSDFGFARDGIAAECPPCLESVAVADLDLDALERARSHGTVRNWSDRRTDLFQVVSR